ncbi:HAD hydrolase family protein [uncultured Microbacterium sp.]|uniref:HAD family hydrolase n=1 Tax=uncultured Microbacterium sp. TaxID=191216 RepID=UPI002638FBA0|nr:HAD hydrolase family protein [uncultured Microbacterium sp.]
MPYPIVEAVSQAVDGAERTRGRHPAGANKGVTILRLLAHLGIDPADAIGIGDNWNDAEMYEVCGLSIAMGNAAPGIAELADQVTETIDADGIHHAFVRNGLI